MKKFCVNERKGKLKKVAGCNRAKISSSQIEFLANTAHIREGKETNGMAFKPSTFNPASFPLGSEFEFRFDDNGKMETNGKTMIYYWLEKLKTLD